MLVLVLFLTSLLFSAYLAAKVASQEQRIRLLESRPSALSSPVSPLVLAEFAKPALERARVAIQIEQDHERPIFAQLLKQRLIAEDAIPSIVGAGDSLKDADIVINGKVKCNGYEEMFFEATLTCSTPEGVLFTLSEKPPQGGRQANLSNTLVTRLRQELQVAAERQERRQALDQLGG